ncbi:Excinuclease ABC subunit C [Prochlorococcus marinus str. NATL2A]|uniref:UvrABC system protein C n=1 Tax=Prochlorococcus marinus (strain NATL2A) TaxID=59920 RepID=UVRC_PROMT|nr:excinuclease ABC subunit UvrC [Prochlorococcus marinus]Q46L08.1 RecName: Full=UvrABC system protein C; Short=Protein UvrC; AltName: Full=Excinuclease ABC subunit C [Prochlorococcus marinus str. NATL2A]AAZ57820.1 Excinuclease ABC subunit C [Prochlorococcus marinus str. NATL2A]
MELTPLIRDKSRLSDFLKDIPNDPGCYLMKDGEDRLLYVGKSKKLRNRVRSYFRSGNELSPRISLMVRQVADIELIVTDNESEALTLESNLIKSHQPYFNVLLKDDKKYPYVCITWGDKYPRIFLTRKRRQRQLKDKYYGPYVDVYLLRQTLFSIKKLFPLRQRRIPLYKDRTCLNYSIGRCPGVCQEEISSEDYKNTLKRVEMIFQGRTDELRILLEKQMISFSESLKFEEAGSVRDQLKGIDRLYESQKMIIPDSSVCRDIIAMASEENISSVQIFQMRSGKLIGRLGYFSDNSNFNSSQILQQVIENHYSNVDPVEIPSEILVQHQLVNNILISDWLSEIKKQKVNINVPKRSRKAEIIKLVEKNANLELQRIKQSQDKNLVELDDLTNILDLENIPKRIECYDISHIQGSDAVASQVVFIDGIAARQHYRRYKIKSPNIKIGHSDDFESMAEVITRRFRRWARFKEEGGDIDALLSNESSVLDNLNLNDWPDLVVIDGGKGQLSSVVAALEGLKLDQNLNVISLAKKKEEVFIPKVKQSLVTESNQPGMLLLRRLRDEAHRFAITFHRQKRSQRMKRSQLNEIPGLGPQRIKLLLEHFRSIEAIQMATFSELSSTPGLGRSTAVVIRNYFHPDKNI